MTEAEGTIVTLTITMSSDSPSGIGRGRRWARVLGGIRHGGDRLRDDGFTLGEVRHGGGAGASGMAVGQDERQMDEGKGATFEGERYQKKREELASLGRLG